MGQVTLGDLNKEISEKSFFLDDLKKNICQIIVGQDELINKILSPVDSASLAKLLYFSTNFDAL